MLRTQAVLAIYDGKHEQALQLLDKAISADPEDYNAVYYRGIVFTRLGQYAEAIKSFELVRNNQQKTEGLYFELGYTHYLNDNYESAVAALQQAEVEYPRHAPVKYYLGLTHYLQAQYEQSLEPLTQAAELDEQFGASAAYLTGSALVNLQRHKEAEKILNDALDEFPESIYQKPITELLAKISSDKEEAKAMAAKITLGYAYDDNVGLFPDGEPLPNNVKASDSRVITNAALALKLYSVNTQLVQTSLEVSNSSHASLTQYDLLRKSVSMDLRDTGKILTWGLRYELTSSELDSLDYQTIKALIPHFLYRHKSNLLSMGTIVFKDTDYELSGQELRSSNYYELTYRAYFLRPGNAKNKLYTGVRYEGNNAIDDEFDHRAITLEAGYDTRIDKGRFAGYLKIGNRDYNASINSRESQRVELNLKYSYPLMKSLHLDLGGNYLNNSSSDAAFDYTRSVISTALRWTI